MCYNVTRPKHIIDTCFCHKSYSFIFAKQISQNLASDIHGHVVLSKRASNHDSDDFNIFGYFQHVLSVSHEPIFLS